MIVFANNKKQVIEESSNLYNFLNFNNINKYEGLAIAVNNDIISKASWSTYILKENDKITIITATQGG